MASCAEQMTHGGISLPPCARLGSVVFVSAVILALVAPRAEAVGPNVVMIVVDDLGWVGTSVQMDASREDSRSDFYQTPRLEQLAKQGITLSNAYSASSVCSPSRASILTGKSPAQLGMTDLVEATDPSHVHYKKNQGHPMIPPVTVDELPNQEVTIPEYMKMHRPGYVAAHFGKWHLGARSPHAHGFDHLGSDGLVSSLLPPIADSACGRKCDPRDTFLFAQRAIAFMQQQVEANRPFFVQVWFNAVHFPVQPRLRTSKKWRDRPRGTVHGSRGYAGATEDVDTAFGMILDSLEALGIDDETYVIFTSDNGGANLYGDSNLPLNRGKAHLSEGGLRVPLIVRGPGIPANSRSDEAVISWDFLPTIRDWLGIEAPLPSGVEGVSLASLFRGEGKPERPIPGLYWYLPNYYPWFGGTDPQAALRSGKNKLVLYFETHRTELYDLMADLEESNDLSSAQPELARQLTQQLNAYLEQIGAKLPRRRGKEGSSAVK